MSKICLDAYKNMYNQVLKTGTENRNRANYIVFDLLVMFSADGGIRTGSKLPVLTAMLLHAGLGQLGKGCFVRGTTTRRLPYWANGHRLCRFIAYRLQCGRLPSTDLTRLYADYKCTIINYTLYRIL